MIKFIKSIYLSKRLFQIGGGIIAAFVASYFFPILLPMVQIALGVLGGLVVLDILMLYRSNGLTATRITPERLSNGDQNEIELSLENRYPFATSLEVIDEIPIQFQLRDLQFNFGLEARSQRNVKYLLRPTERGEYHFGALNIFAFSPFELIKRRYTFDDKDMVPTYPSFVQMRQYELMAISNRLSEIGIKKVRRLGHTSEFEQIKEYVRGDDYRTVNWKATSRSGRLMVNQYTDEKAQNVFCLIDKSRVMKMPFEGMTLLDYAINSALVISNIAIKKHDKAGLITFSEKINTLLPPDNRPTHSHLIMNALYNQTTQFLEADYEKLYITIKRKINQRSLLILFTNFESIAALKRQMAYFKGIAKQHLLLVIFFENTELRALTQSRPYSTEEIYLKAIGENFLFEKKQIVRELEINGILTVFTSPQNLTVSVINKYLELKARGLI
ncbi:MAG: DUF58 domain-containing protein [Bacteroidia bacterium]